MRQHGVLSESAADSNLVRGAAAPLAWLLAAPASNRPEGDVAPARIVRLRRWLCEALREVPANAPFFLGDEATMAGATACGEGGADDAALPVAGVPSLLRGLPEVAAASVGLAQSTARAEAFSKVPCGAAAR